jgi:hypothetical protein
MERTSDVWFENRKWSKPAPCQLIWLRANYRYDHDAHLDETLLPLLFLRRLSDVSLSEWK